MSSASIAPDLLTAPVVRSRSARLSVDDEADAREILSDHERSWLVGQNRAGELAFLGGRLLLRGLVGELLHLDPADVPLAAHCVDCGRPHGRPMVVGAPLHVSLSRTERLIVAAANWHTAVGVDVEPSPTAPDRLDAIEALTGIRTLLHWTRVEAVLKADGRGLRVDPRDVLVTQRGRGLDAAVAGSRLSYRLLDVAPDDHTVGSVAVAR